MTVKIGYIEGLAGCLLLTLITSNMPWSMDWYKGQVSTEQCRPVTLVFSTANKNIVHVFVTVSNFAVLNTQRYSCVRSVEAGLRRTYR